MNRELAAPETNHTTSGSFAKVSRMNRCLVPQCRGAPPHMALIRLQLDAERLDEHRRG